MEDSFIQYSEGEKHFTLKSFYIFNYKIDQVWNIISHPAKLLVALGKWVDGLHYEEGDKKQELIFQNPMKFKKHSKLSFRWKSIFQCRLEVKDIVENEFYKRILFDSYALYPFYIKYKIIYNLYWNSVEENTLLIHEVVCEVNNNMFQNDQEQNRKERYIMFKKIEEMLNNDITFLYQEEGIILDLSIDESWNIVTDWRKFKEHVPQICFDISYDGDPHRIGTEMKIINKNKDKMGFTNLRVIECSNIDKNKKLKFNEFSEIVNFNATEIDLKERCKYVSRNKNKNLNSNKNKENQRELTESLFNDKSNRDYFDYRVENRIRCDILNQIKDSENTDYSDSVDIEEKIDKYSGRNPLNESKKDEGENKVLEYRYVLECYEGVPKCPLQLLIFKFIKLSDDKSLFVFRHEFKQPVRQQLIKNIGIEKKQILIDFKNSINKQKKNE